MADYEERQRSVRVTGIGRNGNTINLFLEDTQEPERSYSFSPSFDDANRFAVGEGLGTSPYNLLGKTLVVNVREKRESKPTVTELVSAGSDQSL